jgi:type II secretory pathway predicted ATPase ExeA
MIQRYFGLGRLPFDRALAPADLYSGQGLQELSARLDYIVRSRDFGLITGEIGAGKSTAIRALAARLDSVRHPFLYLADSGLDPRGFYREALAQFGIAPAFHQRDARRQFDQAFLDAYENQGKQPVIVIDEAHLLSPAMLAELRFISSFRFDSLCPFALILAGQPELRATLRLRAFEAIRQRVGVRYHLAGLPEPETKAYIEHSLKHAGATRPLFTDAAIAQIHTITRGIPRLINTLATACLLDVLSQNGQVADTQNVERVQLDYDQI